MALDGVVVGQEEQAVTGRKINRNSPLTLVRSPINRRKAPEEMAIKPTRHVNGRGSLVNQEIPTTRIGTLKFEPKEKRRQDSEGELQCQHEWSASRSLPDLLRKGAHSPTTLSQIAQLHPRAGQLRIHPLNRHLHSDPPGFADVDPQEPRNGWRG